MKFYIDQFSFDLFLFKKEKENEIQKVIPLYNSFLAIESKKDFLKDTTIQQYYPFKIKWSFDQKNNNKNKIKILKKIIEKELGLSKKIDFLPSFDLSELEAYYDLKKDIPVLVSKEFLFDISEKIQDSQLDDYEFLFDDPLFYSIIDDIYIDSNDLLVFQDSFLLIKKNNKKLKDELLMAYEQKKRKGAFVFIPFSKEDYFLLCELIKEWPFKILSIIERNDQQQIVILKNLHPDLFPNQWVEKALLDIKRGSLPEYGFHISFYDQNNNSQNDQNQKNKNIKWQYLVWKAYVQLMNDKNKFLMNHLNSLQMIQNGQSGLYIKARFYSYYKDVSYFLDIIQDFSRQNQNLFDSIHVYSVNNIEDGSFLRWKFNSFKSLLLSNQQYELFFIVEIENNTNNEEKSKEKIYFEEEENMITEKEKENFKTSLKKYYNQVCRDGKDIVSLEEFKDMTIMQLLYLIPSSFSNKNSAQYCYEFLTLKELLSNSYMNPLTGLPFPNEVLYMIENLQLFWMGLFSLGPLNGWMDHPNLPFVQFENDSLIQIENISSLIKINVQYSFFSFFDDEFDYETKSEEKFGNEVELMILQKSEWEDVLIKDLVEKLWKNGFFFNSWASQKMMIDQEISVHPEKTIPYLLMAQNNLTTTKNILSYLSSLFH